MRISLIGAKDSNYIFLKAGPFGVKAISAYGGSAVIRGFIQGGDTRTRGGAPGSFKAVYFGISRKFRGKPTAIAAVFESLGPVSAGIRGLLQQEACVLVYVKRPLEDSGSGGDVNGEPTKHKESLETAGILC